MTNASEAAKAALVASAQALAGALSDSGEQRRLRDFIGELYCHVPPADTAGRDAAALYAAALSLWQFGGLRGPAEAKLRVHNPEDGGTVVEVVNDDMPFLVDSLCGAINDDGREVRLVIHPTLEIVRDAAGRLVDIEGAGARRESWMRIVIAREPDEAARQVLAERLNGVLAHVRTAVADWRAMRAALQAAIGELTARPPTLPPDELAEGIDFLRWLDDDNYTYLGFRDFLFPGVSEPGVEPLGLLRDPDYPVFGVLRDLSVLPQDVRDFVRRRELLIVAKTNRRAPVHRNVPMDAIGVRRFGPAGEVIGVRLFIGLFTSLAYSSSPRSVPLLRVKVGHILTRAGLSPTGHDGKSLLHILDTFPRDELFQIREDELLDTALGILNLQERQRIALFVRRDPLERFASCLVYIPRDRYSAELRLRLAAILERAFAGTLADFRLHLDESALARVQFIVATTRGAVPRIDVAALERELADAGRSWSDRLADTAHAAFGETAGREQLRCVRVFPVAYQSRTAPAQAVADIERIGAVLAGSPLEVSLHPRLAPAERSAAGLRLYRGVTPVVLSDVLPILENLGLRIVAEEPFAIETAAGMTVWVHEFNLAADGLPQTLAAGLRRRFEAAVVAAWTGEIENDGFNRLVLKTGLSARQCVILRLYCKVLRQAGSSFSQAYMEETLARHAAIAGRLVRLFELRFDPAGGERAALDALAEVQAIDHALDAVESLDEDRILRNYLTLVLKTVRTNYFQPAASGEPKPYVSVKLASSALDLLPQPRPLFEIYVYSPRMEGIHMRAGKVARGGIRWSDRREDFRTEILGLMKAQTVKNAVIVPVGSKGGFVVKHPPAGRDEFAAEGVECYRILMRGLLDLTDNIVANGAGNGTGQRIVPPPAVVRHDPDDPYLVVAADKGTATFSDIANGIA